MFSRTIRPVLLPLLLAVTIASSQAQETAHDGSSRSGDPRISALISSLGKTRTPTDAAISPDGRIVAWSVRGSKGEELHLTELSSATDKTITPAPGATCGGGAPTWSPDGESLAYLSTCMPSADGQPQVIVWSKKTGESQQLTHLTGAITSPAWSPDGKKIGFLFVENATRSAGALAAMKPWDGVIGEDGVEVQRVGVADVASGSFAQVTPRTLHVYEFNWSPDSSKFAYVAAPPPGENTWWVAQIYTQQALGGDPTSILDTKKVDGPLHGLQIALPRWSPDGKQIAFIGGLMSDQGSTGGDIWSISSGGGKPKDLTPGRTSTPAYFAWLNEEAIGISEHLGGSSRLIIHRLQTGQDDASKSITFPESIGSGTAAMSISISQHGDIAIIRSSFEHAPEVWAGRMNALKQISHLNDAIKPLWGKTENVEWMNEGFHVQGWLLYPANYDPAKKYPLIVSVHGGPSSAVSPRWPGLGYGGVPFSSLGYFVFMPNPRGSYGQGEAFTQANRKDFGYGDLRDITTGMDTIEARLPIDKSREGLTGWSYGGFMTMFAVSQTKRFHAAVAGAGISDWKSYYGENSIDQWMIPFFGASVYDDPAVYSKSSAIEYIKNVTTPTLVVVGDRDGECPAPQSFEFWHGLRAVGVKTQLVVYPNEGHGFRSPEHRRDVLERALNWFETEMPAKVSGTTAGR
ncbi:MAG: S9 family peptidase [Edaphobacter sp.]|uniref:alpha/beta hydrolase family protein n=1 Tax=Edaphobacter sp. TaxID=1934404 RepID=UPI002395F109|nr:S9 family peptidase [Edaphobacter sp.]MDE1176151.1 S9 family peptidase [Edaphobacter sp.]